ncbi:DegV family protein [Mycoplasma sp. CSL7503-lung]|uniref:DegV family protein n=1 Tax=Mycoplasma sp. CSL7503-lung TaxID=536372 RepID=UPI0021CEA8D3|nr:DegV family protein [Mycoplasma sp. CSL7503-lung]MCU4706524.1 DegV family protein [Mycoplasma sp. CSL7503-lung]
MKKIAIVVDSSIGLTEKEANSKGFYFLPLIIEIDGKNFYDGIDISHYNIFENFNLETKTYSTSATPIGYSCKMIEKLSKEYDKIVVFPISKYLSSQYSMLKNLEKDYPKLRVIESVNISGTLQMQVNKFVKTYKKTNDLEYSIKQVEPWDEDLDVTLIPKYNNYLLKGGRLTPAAATLAKLLKVVPLIRFENGELLKQGKGLVFNRTVEKEIESKLKKHNYNTDILIISSDLETINYYIEYIKNKYDIIAKSAFIPSVILIHVGPEAVVVATKKDINKFWENNDENKN